MTEQNLDFAAFLASAPEQSMTPVAVYTCRHISRLDLGDYGAKLFSFKNHVCAVYTAEDDQILSEMIKSTGPAAQYQYFRTVPEAALADKLAATEQRNAELEAMLAGLGQAGVATDSVAAEEVPVAPVESLGLLKMTDVNKPGTATADKTSVASGLMPTPSTARGAAGTAAIVGAVTTVPGATQGA